MAGVVLHNAQLLDPEAEGPLEGGLLLAGDRIADRLRPGEVGPADARRVDLGGRSITPGFLDLHFHGGLVFCPASGMAAAIEAASAALVRLRYRAVPVVSRSTPTWQSRWR